MHRALTLLLTAYPLLSYKEKDSKMTRDKEITRWSGNEHVAAFALEEKRQLLVKCY